MNLSLARTVTSLALALALIVGGALHGAMSGGMASPMTESAMSQMDANDACDGCAAPADGLSAADCGVICLNQVGVIAASAVAPVLEGKTGPLHPSAVMSGIAPPPDPSPPKHHLG